MINGGKKASSLLEVRNDQCKASSRKYFYNQIVSLKSEIIIVGYIQALKMENQDSKNPRRK